MLVVNEKGHISTVIASLDKIYKDAKIFGKLQPRDIFYLDAIYKLLTKCSLGISDDDKRKLLEIYNKLSYQSKYICPSTPIKKYTLSARPKFIQAESSDCNSFNEFGKIIYWQIDNLSEDIDDVVEDVIVTGFLDDKQFDTYANFEIGKTISYTEIGRICFLALGQSSTSFEIKDVLGNIITDQFNIEFVDQINSVLMVSKNIMSHGEIFFKIKKPNV